KDAQGNKLKPRISKLRRYLGKQSDAVLQKGVFSHTEIEDWHDYVTSLLGQESTLRTARHMLTERGVIKEAVEGAEPGYTSLANAWEKAGFKPHGLTSLIQEAGMDVKSIDNLTIPQSMASSLKSYADALKPSTHKEMGKLVRQWDRTMALYRGMLTTPWPSFHARNLISGTFQAATHGKIPMRDVLAGEYKAIAYLHGNKDAMKFLHEVETSDILKGHGWLADTFGDVGAESASRMPTSLREVFAPWKGALSKNWNPLNMRGVRNHVDDVAEAARKGKPIVEKQPWYAEAGENLYGAVEFILRAGYYEALREKDFSAAAAKYLVKQAHFDYSKLSKFEKNVARRGSLFYCVPIDSQILTKAGWKNYDELKIGEEVLGYDIESHRQKWTTVEDVAVFDYDGILMSINKQQGNFQWLFTPNHRWPVRARSDSKRGSIRKMVKGYQLRSNHAIPYTAPLEKWPEHSLLSVREAAIIGWLITDGHIGTKKRRWTWAIYQSPKKFAQEIRDLLGDDCLGENIHPDSGVIQFRLSKSLRDHLSSLGFSNRKDAINIVGKLDKASAEAMWEAMYKADGDICHPRNSHHFACEKQDVFDVAQMLVQLLGMKIQQGGRGGYVSKDRTWCKLADPYKNGYSTIGSQWYKGKIWCPRTGTGTWVMRRNGKVIITGNTWRRKSVPHSLLVLAERPGGAKAQAIRAINRATQGDTYTPQYLKESVSIPVGQNEEGNTTYLRQGGLPLEDLNMLALRGSTLGTVKRTAEKLVSESNPLLTGAIESLTGRQMYTGRQVKDLASRTEKVTGEPWPLIDRTLALSPVSRVIGEGEKYAGVLGLRETGRSLPMNLANALSGLYFTTPDAEKWKLLDASNALRERLEEEPM
ncbi:MAG: hypothetical protein M0R74_20220, partial [Dehalococcoidia bacterium]|nr:hypothetical protein [Dehalococcoidia bacterium]